MAWRTALSIDRLTRRGIGTHITIIRDAIAIVIFLAWRTALSIDRLTRRGIGTHITIIRDAIAIVIFLALRTALSIDRLTRRGVGTQIKRIDHTIAVGIGGYNAVSGQDRKTRCRNSIVGRERHIIVLIVHIDRIRTTTDHFSK